MMHVDIGTFSPPSQIMRSFPSRTAKRSRSPDVLPSSIRPAKRPSLAFGDAYPAIQINSSSSSRRTSEDWVQQTGGLSINSPSLSFGSGPPTLEVTRGNETPNPLMYEDMNTESDEDGTGHFSMQHTSHPQSPYPDTHLLLNANQMPPDTMQPTHIITSQHDIQSPTFTSTSLPSYPVINTNSSQLQTTDPPLCTTFEKYDLRSYQAPIGSRTRPSTPEAMAVSPASSFTAQTTFSSTPTRKQRFTMGPRADCEKCRLGVKGHWMHLD